MKKLKSKYRKVIERYNKSGSGKKPSKYFDALDAVLGNKPAIRPSVVVDTLSGGTSVEGIVEGELGQEDDIADHTSNVDDLLEGAESVSVANTESRLESRATSLSVDEPATSQETKKAGRKRGKVDRLEKVVGGIMDKILKSQSESDKRYYNLEEK